MNNIINFLLIFCSIPVIVFRMKYQLHMLQLNSYMNERYTKWIKTNTKKIIKKREWFILLSLPICFLNLLLGVVFFSLYSITLFFLRDRVKEKKPFVVTMRVKRLIICEIILSIILIIPALIFSSTFTLLSGLAVFILAPFLWIMLGNILMSPIEGMINKYYYNDAKKKLNSYKNLTIIGITGSYGKTSTKYILNKILSTEKNVLITPESYNTTMGVVKTVRGSLNPSHQIFVVEMGAKKNGDIKEICDLVKPEMGVITEIGEQHLETFGNIENIKKTKNELLMSLPTAGKAFINIDNENILSLPRNDKAEYISYSMKDKNADFFLKQFEYNEKGSELKIIFKDKKEYEFRTKLVGRHNILNVLATIAISHSIGISYKSIYSAVRELEPIEHRLQVKKNSVYTVIDDAFNSNPVGSEMALEILKLTKGNKKIIITPGMIELGDKEYYYNNRFGKMIADVADYAILVGEKQTKPIQDGLKEKGYAEGKMIIAKNINDALDKLKNIVSQGDIVLFENDLPDDYNE